MSSLVDHGHPPAKKAKGISGRETGKQLGIFPDITDLPIKKEFDSEDEEGATPAHLCDVSDECVNFDSEELVSTCAAQRVAGVDANLGFISDVNAEESRVPLETQTIMETFPDDNYILPETKGENEDQGLNVLQLRLPPSPSGTVERDERGLKISSSNRCIYCRYECSSRDTINKTREKMEIHLARFHPEHFFPDEVGLKLQQFQRILVDFLFPEFIRKIGVHTSCTLCKAKFQTLKSYDNHTFMIRHLASKHKTELKHRLSDILEDEPFQEKLVSFKPQGSWCRCGIYQTSPHSMRTHKRVYCNLIGNEDKDNELSRGKDGEFSGSLKDNVAVALPPPPKKAKKSGTETETELGIFPDIPDARLKKEFDNADFTSTSFDLSEGSIYITADTTSPIQQVAPYSDGDGNLEIKEGLLENEGLLGMQPTIKLEVFPDKDIHLAKLEDEGDVEDTIEDVLQKSQLQESQVEKGNNDRLVQQSCMYCRFSFRGDGKNAERHRHQVRYHPEHFFPEEKEQVSGVKRKQLQRIIVDFLFPEFIRRLGTMRSCTLCGSTYKGRTWGLNEISVRKHLVVEHISELKARLNAILEDEGLEAKLTNCRPEGLLCSCGVYLPRMEKMQMHHKQFYCKMIATDDDNEQKDDLDEDADHLKPIQSPQQGPPVVKTEAVPDSDCTNSPIPLECDDNEGTSDEEPEPVMLHEMNAKVGCSNSNDIAVADDDDTVPNFMANFLPVAATKLKAYCKLCTKTFYRKDALAHWNHYCLKGLRRPITNSKEKIESESVKEFVNDGEVLQLFKGKVEKRKAKNEEEEEHEMYLLRCTYCRFVCRANATGTKKREELQLHQLRHHPEHFFPEEKRQLSGEKRKQFQRILVGFLFPRFIQNGEGFRSCALCGEARYQNSCWHKTYVYLRRHLIMQHKNELKDRLKAILEDGRLEEKLSGSRKAEAWCRCGMYLNLPKEMKMHQRRYCILTAPK